MVRVLFVDDESRVLEQWQRIMAQRVDCAADFALGADAAQAYLETERYDVVVSDLRMPKMDGAALLQVVSERQPDAWRVILSNEADIDATVRTVAVAHRSLFKPCEAAALFDLLDHAERRASLLDRARVRGVLGGAGPLPIVPEIYAELMLAISNSDVTLREICRIVERDGVVSAKVLHMVNSAFFGLRQSVSSLEQAISLLGLNALRAIVLSEEIFCAFRTTIPAAKFSLPALQAHATLTAQIARKLMPNRQLGDEAFTAALLHDVGKVLLASRLPDSFCAMLDLAHDRGVPVYEVEAEVGVTHAHVGAYLFELWGLPFSLVSAVATHHSPERLRGTQLDVPAAVYIANALAHEVTDRADPDRLNLALLARLGVLDRLDDWRVIGHEIVGAVADVT